MEDPRDLERVTHPEVEAWLSPKELAPKNLAYVTECVTVFKAVHFGSLFKLE